MSKSHVDWIIDSRASKHVIETSNEFIEYHPSKNLCLETVQTANGTSQLISGTGLVRCSPSITLSSVLYVSLFLVNLFSVSSLVDQLNCIILFNKNMCVFQEKETERKIGTEVKHDCLWYMNREAIMLVATMNRGQKEVILQHHRLRHLSFDSLSKLEHELMNKVDRHNFFCDACELGKQTRSTYKMSGLQSIEPFILVHSDV
jgi:GAG-pre-integrase domain